MRHILITTDRKSDNISVFQEEPAIIVMANRDDLPALKKLETASQAGIYILLGENKRYVGQASNSLFNRINMHDSKKDWWNRVLFFTKTGNDLDKSQLDYLEEKLIKLFRTESPFEIDNVTGGNNSYTGMASKMTADNLWEIVQSVLEEIANIKLFELNFENTEQKDYQENISQATENYSIKLDDQVFQYKTQVRPYIDMAKYLFDKYPEKIQELVVDGRPWNRVDGNSGMLLGNEKVVAQDGTKSTVELVDGVHLYKNFSKSRMVEAIYILAKMFGVEVIELGGYTNG